MITEFQVFDDDSVHLIFELRERNRPEIVLSNHLQIHFLQLHGVLQGHHEVLEGVAEDVAIGRAEGEARRKTLAILEVRFNRIPKKIEKALRSMTDLIALESLVEHAKACKSLDEFAEALK